MFNIKICLTTVLLSLHFANSYILLTANLDDVHSLAKQIAESPVVTQLNDMFRRATSTFNEHNKPDVRKHNPEHTHKRTNPELDVQKPEVRKHNQGDVHKRPDPELNVDPQINSRENSKEKTEKSLPQPTEENKLKTDAAPANDNDDIEVWRPDKKALIKELTSQNSASSGEGSEENDVKPSKSRRTRGDADAADLGRNASFYLTSIKKIFENI